MIIAFNAQQESPVPNANLDLFWVLIMKNVFFYLKMLMGFFRWRDNLVYVMEDALIVIQGINALNAKEAGISSMDNAKFVTLRVQNVRLLFHRCAKHATQVFSYKIIDAHLVLLNARNALLQTIVQFATKDIF